MTDPINPHSVILHKARKRLLQRSINTRKNSYEAQIVAALEGWQLVANDLLTDNITLASEIKDWKGCTFVLGVFAVIELIVMLSMEGVI